MQTPHLRARYRHIMLFFTRLTLSLAFWDILLPRLGMRSLSRRSRPGRYRQIATDFRLLAIRMGGVMIKVGQFLSSRLDVLPAEITDELSGLQDEVPPEDFEDIRALAIERHPHEPLLMRVWGLRENLTANDAVYVALAEALDARLLTCDGSDGRAPEVRGRVEVVGRAWAAVCPFAASVES